MTPLVLAAAFLIASHVGLSAAPVRARLVARLGRRAFFSLYGLIALGAIVWLVLAFRAAPVVPLWPQAPWTRLVPLLVMPVASVLLVAGLATARASVVSDARLPAGGDPAPGILKVTRHPVMWAFILWAGAHIPPNGDAAALVFFGAILALGLMGLARIDAKRAAADPEGWRRHAAATSSVPFLAMIRGRARAHAGDIGWMNILGGLALYALLLGAHAPVIGMSPWPA